MVFNCVCKKKKKKKLTFRKTFTSFCHVIKSRFDKNPSDSLMQKISTKCNVPWFQQFLLVSTCWHLRWIHDSSCLSQNKNCLVSGDHTRVLKTKQPKHNKPHPTNHQLDGWRGAGLYGADVNVLTKQLELTQPSAALA